MITRQLGRSDVQTSVVGLGTNNFGGRLDLEQTRRVVDQALEEGVTHLDTADVYGHHFGNDGAPGRSEQFLGEVLKGRREQVVLATKFGGDMRDGYAGPRGTKKYIERAIDASLRRLQTEYIDLYWYHRPDKVTPLDETFGALGELVQAGKVKALGASNLTAPQLETAAQHGCVALQNEYSLLHRGPEHDGTLAGTERLGVAFIPYFPLASGLLTGKYSRFGARPQDSRLTNRDQLASEDEWALIDALTSYARERSLTLVQVAIGALLAKPSVASVIAGATRPEQVSANAAATEWQPSAADLTALESLLSG
ncbi:MAG: aldo/keto reductase [Solirubrobacterales bacterium]|nr:aldo/keto reductase [Solirubrobacterales bacterium]